MDNWQSHVSARLVLAAVVTLAGVRCGPHNPLAPERSASSGGKAVERGCASRAGRPLPPGPPTSVTITFDGLANRPDGSPFHRYSESGFNVAAAPGPWVVWTEYGHPPPAIVFERQAAEPTETGEVVIGAGGAPFTVTTVDLYSSITPLPYTMTGFLDACPVFTVSDVVPNTFGRFVTVLNPHSTDTIDTLVILLSNPETPCCRNPVGLDNVAVRR